MPRKGGTHRAPVVPLEGHADLVDEEVSVVPEKYNSSSGLTREVGPGSNVVDFDLKGAAVRR